jgi:UDP-2-acetamido-3-amino-2,3-dideoxy-glucuronate N-acetyltransferase
MTSPLFFSSHPVQVAVIGCGAWGNNLVRNFAQLGALRWVCDTRPAVLERLKQQWPEVNTTQTLEALWNDPSLDAVVIATPGPTHAALATQALQAGKHVYIEKPMARTTYDCETLLTLAEEKGLHIMVGHLLLYHPAFNRLKQAIQQGQLGRLKYLQSDRLNWNWPRADFNVLWDLLPHDLSLLLYLTNEPFEVNEVLGHCSQPKAQGGDGKTDTVQVKLSSTHSALTATLQASWVFPKKQVQCLLVGSQGNAILDDTLPGTDTLTLLLPQPDSRSWHAEPLECFPLEPLKLECLHFLNAVQGGWQAVTNANNGLAVVRLLEAIQHRLDAQALT